MLCVSSKQTRSPEGAERFWNGEGQWNANCQLFLISLSYNLQSFDVHLPIDNEELIP